MNLRFIAPLIVIAAAWCGSLAADEPATVLVYEAQQPKGTDAKTAERNVTLLVETIRRRLRVPHGAGFSSGWSWVETVGRRLSGEPVERGRVRARDDGKIEVTIPGTDAKTVQRVARLVESSGTLEFRILASRVDNKDLVDRAEKAGGPTVNDAKGNRLAWWVPVEAGEEAAMERGNTATRKRKEKGREGLDVFVIQDPFNVTGRYLESASVGLDPRGRPCVEFAFDRTGAKLFGGLTGSNLPDEVTGVARRLSIILDGRVHSAPNIQSAVFDRAEITGNFTKQQVEDLAAVLNAGALPVRIKQVEKSTVNLKR